MATLYAWNTQTPDWSVGDTIEVSVTTPDTTAESQPGDTATTASAAVPFTAHLQFASRAPQIHDGRGAVESSFPQLPAAQVASGGTFLGRQLDE